MAEVSDPADHYQRSRIKKEFGPSEQQIENEGLDGNGSKILLDNTTDGSCLVSSNSKVENKVVDPKELRRELERAVQRARERREADLQQRDELKVESRRL